MDFVEKYVMTRLYRFTFCPVVSTTDNDEESDLLLQDKIRKLHWVNAYILDAQLCENRTEVTTLVDQAIEGQSCV